MKSCLRCGDAIDRKGGKLLQYCAFCVRLERPSGWQANPEVSADRPEDRA